ncbi:MAG: sugar transferase [Clostridia bacterium]|nr:sugar transferase [Clostridia bacterium]
MYRHFFKRFFDILLSGLALIILSPLLLIIALLVRIKHGSPVLFTQYRPGKDGKIFKFIKFRSMSNKTDKDGYLLPDKDRLTKFGKFLRKTSIDELPQLWCIFIGKMSIVGPRPRMVEECVFLTDEQQDRFKVRPGITGLAQVNGRNDITFDKVVDFDKKYVEKITLWGDIKILFLTVIKVFKREGVNKQGTVSNEFYGDYLLREKQIEQEYYNKKIQQAREMILEAKAQKKSRTKDVLYLNGSVNAKDFEQQETTEEVLVKENKN